MAECLESVLAKPKADWKGQEQNFEEQNNEVEALKSFYENTDNFEVYEAASIEDGRLFSLQFKIKMEKQGSLAAELWIPIETSKIHKQDDDQDQESATTSKATAQHVKDGDLPILERSNSGKQAHTVIRCDYLPQIHFDVLLPVDYPSHKAPKYTISCVWLSNSQLVQACGKLDEIWSENLNMPVLYTWIDWLQSNLIGFLDIFEKPNSIVLTPLNNFDLDATTNDGRAVSTYVDSDSLIYEFLRYNHVEELKAFRNSMQNCLICFDEKLGSDFYRLHNCKHHFCGDCLSSMCQMHVKDGTIQFLKCPENKCEELVPFDIMQEVLSAEDFERWERLLFQRTLDSMEDIMYCPKCQNPITIEKSNTHAFCMYCHMDYCKGCKDAWHTGECVTGEQKMAAKLKTFNLDAKTLLAMTDEDIKRYFKNTGAILSLKAKVAETNQLSELELLLRKYLRCPQCKAYIEKIDGCNKMTCLCGISICYICGQKIAGYEHFQNGGKCNLWSQTIPTARINVREQHAGQRAVNRVLDLVPEQQRNIIACPTCGQRCLKQERNNHIKCWLCTTNFCFCCKKKIVGIITNHFKFGSACKQHSD